jgi:ribosomal protein L37E
MNRQEFLQLAKNRNKYRVLKQLDGELNYANVGDFFYSDTLFDRGYNMNALVESGYLELVPRVFPFEKEIVGKNHFSVITVCPECGSNGVNMPLEKECGNCGYTETRTYYDAETIYYELLNKEPNPERSDATKSASSNADSNTKQIEP